MSGHSHWATIKHKKAAEDAKRGKVYTKVVRMIIVASRKAKASGSTGSTGVGGELFNNPPTELKNAIEKAKAVNMPKDNIIRAIERGIGSGKEGRGLEEEVVEGYGPGGVAFLIKVLTDNRNRTLSEIRTLFSRFGGSLSEAGSTAYIFVQDPDKPSFYVPVNDAEQAKKVLALAQSLRENEDVQEVYTNFDIPKRLVNE